MRFSEPNTVTDRDTDEESRVWIGTDDAGIKKFNMRAKAENIALEDLHKIVSYCEKNNLKPILATNIDGFLIDHSAFIEPHRIWFDRAILLTKDDSLKKWKGHSEYFKGVNEAMEKILPESSKEERTQQASKWYQEDVIHYISIHPEVVNKKLAQALKNLKQAGIASTVSFTAHRNNFLEFPEVAKLGCQIGVSRVWADRLIPEALSRSSLHYLFKKFKQLPPPHHRTSSNLA